MKAFPWLIAGLCLRVIWATGQWQWFHPDERQLFEFAHYHAHGQLHPFLEVELGARNQTLPWIFSTLWRGLDSFGLGSTMAFMGITHLLLGVLFFLMLWKAVESERAQNPWQQTIWEVPAQLSVSWFLIYLGGRTLLESLSTLAVLGGWIAFRKKAYFWLGAALGLAAFVRYPSALFMLGGVLLVLQTRSAKNFWLYFCGSSLAIGLGGIADLFIYGSFYHSAFSYWAFNHPGGPVETQFGTDELSVYYRFFNFTLSPWISPIFISALTWTFWKRKEWLVLFLPYLIGHTISPHREPRFMIPVVVLGIVMILGNSDLASMPRVRWALRAQLCFWAIWGVLQFMAQTQSNQSALLHAMAQLDPPSAVWAGLDRPIDAFFPVAKTNWLDDRCQWQRDIPSMESPPGEITVISKSSPDPSCALIPVPYHTALGWIQSDFWSRTLRSRPGNAYRCAFAATQKLCPTGIRTADADHPWRRALNLRW